MLKNCLQNKSFIDLNIIQKMRFLMESFCEETQSLGLTILPYRDPEMKIFSQLSPEKQSEAYNHFLRYYNVCLSASKEKIQLNDDPNVLWWVIKEMGLLPTSDLFGKIESDDVIEIYNLDAKQIYRNLMFFRICSYSLEEIFSYEWTTLYIRDEEKTKKLAELCMTALSGKVKEVISGSELGEHILIEAFSSDRHKMNVRHTYIGPLFNKATGLPEAFAIFSKAKVIDRFVHLPNLSHEPQNII